MRIIKPNEPSVVVLCIFSISILCFEDKEIVLWKMRLNVFFCIKDVLHFGYDNSITESITNLFKWLLGFILIKRLQYWIYSCQFVVMRFDKLYDLWGIFFRSYSFIFFILLFLITSFLGNVLCAKWYTWFDAESFAIFSFSSKFLLFGFESHLNSNVPFDCALIWWLSNGLILSLVDKIVALLCCMDSLPFWFVCNFRIIVLTPTNILVTYVRCIMISVGA